MSFKQQINRLKQGLQYFYQHTNFENVPVNINIIYLLFIYSIVFLLR